MAGLVLGGRCPRGEARPRHPALCPSIRGGSSYSCKKAKEKKFACWRSGLGGSWVLIHKLLGEAKATRAWVLLIHELLGGATATRAWVLPPYTTVHEADLVGFRYYTQPSCFTISSE